MAIRRRRRPASQIHFSFDSFLDLVANVVGIILRLILVAWAGARAYQGLPVSVDLPELPEVRHIAKTKEFDDQSRKVQVKNDALQD